MPTHSALQIILSKQSENKMTLHDLETPCLLLDKSKMISNISRMREHLISHNIKLRPHGKTAKSIDVMKYVVDEGTTGITVSTLREAEYYFENGIKDIIYAVGIAPGKLNRIIKLIKKGARLTILLDNETQVDAAKNAAEGAHISIPVLLEIDSDDHRSGINPHSDELIAIANKVHNSPGLELRGVLTHAGASYNCQDIDCIRKVSLQECKSAMHCAQRFEMAGLPCPIVSVGSTPTVSFGKNFQGITEVRAGVYIFQDLVMAGLGVCKIEDIALSVLCSVIGHQNEKGWIVVDAGWMALSRDRSTVNQQVDQGYGLVCDFEGNPIDDLIVISTNQEHGIISSRNGNLIKMENFPVGTLLRILPNHACATAGMHDHYNIIESDSITETWPRINYW
jgi:D-serine deaminase-like pyridoxal phosphate-dependent protein